jgi:nucleoside 2-deoxyribosyltransferase
MRIYIAGPFSHPEEREALQHMIELVKKRYPDANLYIPMEYKVPGDFQKLDGTWNLANHEWAKKVYESDI